MESNEHKTLFVSYNEVESVLSMDDCIACMEDAFKALAAGNVELPLRNLMWYASKAIPIVGDRILRCYIPQ
jgi:ornithine cyclodeaminase/alanine dehydrogenase-like protein (mu-crystallin family)